MDTKPDIQTILDVHAASLGANGVPGGTPFVALPQNYKLESLEPLLPTPVTRKAKAKFTTIESFIAYLNIFKTEATILLASATERRMAAIIDYHTPDANGWGRHRVEFEAVKSEEWAKWMNANNQFFTQAAFATFIEDNLRNIVNPQPAELLQIAKTLEAKREVNFRSAKRLENGDTALQYEEVTTAKGGARGELEIPNKIGIFLQPALGFPTFTISARLRYRLEGGALSFKFEFENLDNLNEDIRRSMIAQVQEATQLAALTGSIDLS